MEGALLFKEGQAKQMSLLCLKYWYPWNSFSQTEWVGDLLQCLEEAGGLLYSKAETYVECCVVAIRMFWGECTFLCPATHVWFLWFKICLGIKPWNSWLLGLGIVIAHFWPLKSIDLPFIDLFSLSWSTWFINIREWEWRWFSSFIMTVLHLIDFPHHSM